MGFDNPILPKRTYLNQVKIYLNTELFNWNFQEQWSSFHQQICYDVFWFWCWSITITFTKSVQPDSDFTFLTSDLTCCDQKFKISLYCYQHSLIPNWAALYIYKCHLVLFQYGWLTRIIWRRVLQMENQVFISRFRQVAITPATLKSLSLSCL